MDFEGFLSLRGVPEGYFGYAWVCGVCVAALGQFKAIKKDFEGVMGIREVPEGYFGVCMCLWCLCGCPRAI